MKSITATKALYIKLGEGGGLAHDCIENGYLQIRYEGVNHEMCMQGRWEEIKTPFPMEVMPAVRHIIAIKFKNFMKSLKLLCG